MFKAKIRGLLKERRDSLFDKNNPNHTLSWIYNWAIWKNYWEIVYGSFEKCTEPKEQAKNFEKLVKFNEYLHLRFSISTQNKKNFEKVYTETELFQFCSLNHIHFGLEKKNNRRNHKFILSGMMAVAYWMAHAPQAFHPIQNGGELAIMFCFVFLYIAAAGGGPWALDRAFAKKA